MTLFEGKINQTYIVKEVLELDEGMQEFLFSLGCYPEEEITLVSKISSNFVVSVKGARYSIDDMLAKCIIVEN